MKIVESGSLYSRSRFCMHEWQWLIVSFYLSTFTVFSTQTLMVTEKFRSHWLPSRVLDAASRLFVAASPESTSIVVLVNWPRKNWKRSLLLCSTRLSTRSRTGSSIVKRTSRTANTARFVIFCLGDFLNGEEQHSECMVLFTRLTTNFFKNSNEKASSTLLISIFFRFFRLRWRASCVMTWSAWRRSDFTVVCVTTGACVSVVSTPRRLAAKVALLAFQRRREHKFLEALYICCKSAPTIIVIFVE